MKPLPSSRRALAVIAAGAAGAALLAALAYGYFFSSIRTAPKPLSAAIPATAAAPSPAPSGAPAAVTPSLAGSWSAGQGSQAGYRVREQFGGQPAPHEAVARTTAVTGSLTAAGSGPLQISALKFTAQLGSLASVDQVAGFNVTQRDRLVSSALGVAQFPTASFEAAGFQLPAAPTASAPVAVSVPGQLTIHGVARAVEVAAQVQLGGDHITVTGSVPISMADFGVSPPRAPFVTAESAATIEFELVMTRA